MILFPGDENEVVGCPFVERLDVGLMVADEVAEEVVGMVRHHATCNNKNDVI